VAASSACTAAITAWIKVSTSPAAGFALVMNADQPDCSVAVFRVRA